MTDQTLHFMRVCIRDLMKRASPTQQVSLKTLMRYTRKLERQIRAASATSAAAAAEQQPWDFQEEEDEEEEEDDEEKRGREETSRG